MKTKLIRTDSAHADFAYLIKHLDEELKIRDGDEHAFYSQYNKVDLIKHVVVAYRNDLPVGCGAIKRFSDRAVEVKRMFVEPTVRGQGVGVEVLAELEVWAKELGFTEAVLETGKRQPEAIRLYEKQGFLRIPNFGQYVGVDNSVCFKKTLN